MANIISEISLDQPLDKFVHISDDNVDQATKTVLNVSRHMYACHKIWLRHTAASTGNRLYVTFNGVSPNANGSNAYVMTGDTLELNNIDFNGLIRVRGSANNQEVSILCWGR